jgi:hypothetical protein
MGTDPLFFSIEMAKRTLAIDASGRLRIDQLIRRLRAERF